MKITTNRLFVLIALWAKLTVQGVSGNLLIIDNKCFTNASSAVGAIYDLSDEKWTGQESRQIQSDVKYVSETSKKLCENLDCYNSGTKWKKKSSFELGRINNLVMDRRWEDFPMYFAGSSTILVGVINNCDFAIPFSLHSKYNAHVMICDRSACMWFILQNDDKTTKSILFRDCKNKPLENVITTNWCDFNRKQDKTILNNIFNDNKWSHFKFVKFGSELKLVNETGDVLFKEDVLMKGEKQVYIINTEVKGIWKIHNFTYLYSETLGDATFFKFKVVPGQQCLSMFIAMCKCCSISMTFFYSDGAQKKSVFDYEHLNNKRGSWQDVMFCINIPKEDLYMQVVTLIKNKRKCKTFWALSDIRTGQKDEFRYITPDPTTWSGKCQSLESGLVVDKSAPNIDVLENWHVCKEDQLGEDCLPCNQFNHGGCPERTKYCQSVNDSSGSVTSKCYCTIGYEGANCQEPCSKYTYGHGCQGSCKNCKGGCTNDNKSGKCNSPGQCRKDYYGEKCDLRLGVFLFSKKPEIDEGVTMCDLTQSSFAGKGEIVEFYKFEYKEVGEEEWKDASEEPLDFNYIETVTLTGLKPKTTYEVRVFGFNNEEDENQMDILKDSIKIYNFTTKPLNIDDLIITCDDYTVNVGIKTENFQDLSKVISLTINNTEMELKEDHYYKDNLEPLTLYMINVRDYPEELVYRLFRTRQVGIHDIEECSTKYGE